MIKRYSQRQENKCNFCFDWFSSVSTLKNSLHICSVCLQKALKTTCYKVPSPDGKDYYQLFLMKNNLNIEHQVEEEETNHFKNTLIENIDDFRNQQIKKLTEKWRDITQQIKRMKNFGANELEKYTNTFQDLIRNYPSTKDILQKNQKKKWNKENMQNLGEHISNQSKTIHVPYSINQQSYNLYISPHKRPLRQNIISPNKQIQVSDFGKKIAGLKIPSKNSSKNTDDSKNSQASFSLKQSQCDQRKRTPLKSPTKDSLLVFSSPKKPQQLLYTKQKRQKDLQIVAQDALKQKIYGYLQSQSTVLPSLYLSMTFDIYDAVQNTNCLNNCIQLVAHNIQQIDIKCYLSMLEWTGVQILKLVKVGLSDEQFKAVLEFIRPRKIQTLVASSNKLTEQALIELNYASENLPHLKNAYLGRNRIQKWKIKDYIKQIYNRFALFL